MARLAITLLGGFAVRRDGRPVTRFESDQVRALLAYLAAAPGRAHTRAHLADLLWPTFPDAAARANLRNTLSRLRYALADHDCETPLIEAGPRTVVLGGGPRVVIDAAGFAALADACAAHGHERAELCAECAPRLREAAELYGGALLAGAPLSRSPVFEEWLVAARARLERQALEIFASLARAAEAAADPRQLCSFARRQLEIEPWRETAHRQLMLGLALLGERGAAMAQYRHCEAVLAHELAIEPDAETRALYERVRNSPSLTMFREAAAPQHNLPAAMAPCIGRERELADLRVRGGRLLTLTGAGGTGKTRLALELARGELSAYADGVHFVALAPLESASAVAPAIAAALNLMLHGDPAAALVSHLRNKHMLLILDNFEHLLEGAGIVTAILEAAPLVHILATSRERLNVLGEHVYLVEGLGYRLGPGAAEAANLPAVRLFVQSARRVQPSFALSSGALDAVLRICRLVQGLPLGLELAAAWLDSLLPAEIADEISRSSSFLRADWRNVPPRQRSMQAAFDWSWRLLSADEQLALSRLGVFRGGWTREAAEQVAGVSLEVLAHLVRKSLVSRGANGRYMMLDLLRQFAVERLPVGADPAAERHSAYCPVLVARNERQLARQGPQIAAAQHGLLEAKI